MGKESNEGNVQQTNPLAGREQPSLTLRGDLWRVVTGLGGDSAVWGEVNDETRSRARNEVNKLFKDLSFKED